MRQNNEGGRKSAKIMEMYFSRRPLDSESIFQLSVSLSTLENWKKKQQPQNVISEFISQAKKKTNKKLGGN